MKWTKFNLVTLLKLETFESKRLYEVLKATEFPGLGWCFEIAYLQNLIFADNKKYDFADIIYEAVKDINDKTELNLCVLSIDKEHINICSIKN